MSAVDDRPAPPILDDPLRRDTFVIRYRRGATLTVLGTMAALALLGHGVSLVGQGAPPTATPGALAWLWILHALHAIARVQTGRAAEARDATSLDRWHVAQTITFVVWAQQLCWVSSPTVAPFALALLSAHAIFDARVCYDSPAIHAVYAASFAVFDLTLFALDLAGGHGAFAIFAEAPVVAWHATWLQVGAQVCLHAVVAFLGRQIRESDAKTRSLAAAQRELAAWSAERQTLSHACNYIVAGLGAMRFSHDVRSPLLVIQLSGELLRDLLLTPRNDEGGPVIRDAAVVTEVEQILEELAAASGEMLSMTAAMARSLRQRERLEPIAIDRAVRAATEHATAGLRAERASLDVEVSLEPATPHLAEGHASTLGNLLVNAVLNSGSPRVVVQGRPVGRWFYVLSFRDFGVGPERRDDALAAIESALSLADRSAGEMVRRRGPYEGYGIALMMAKVFLVRHNGWIAARAPAEGPGVVLDVVLPAVDPASIPDDENHPARVRPL